MYTSPMIAFMHVKQKKNMSDTAAVEDKLASLQRARAGLTAEAC